MIIYDNMGRLVRTIASVRYEPGSYHFTWNGRDSDGPLLPDYLYNLILSDGYKRVASNKLVFMHK